MKYSIVPYTFEWQAAAKRCNERMRASGSPPFLLPTGEVGFRVCGPIEWKQWLVVDESGEVHGGCLMQSQPAWVAGEEVPAVNIQSPLSEGIVDRRHAGVAVWMMKELQQRFPFMYSVGMGSVQAPFARLLKALRWRVELAPFYFRVLSGQRLLAHVAPLRRHRRLGWAVRTGALIPLVPDVVFHALHRFRAARPGPVLNAAQPEWTRVRSRYGFGIERSEEMLGALYGHSDRFKRVSVAGGLAVICRTECQNHPYFGDLRVGTLVDVLCESGAELHLMNAVTAAAQRDGADLLITNQTAPDVIRAVQQNGWLSSTSNYVVALSPALTGRIGTHPVFVTRGDGDGLVNL